MSRTYKDKKWKLRHPENDHTFGVERVAYEVTGRSWFDGEWQDCTYTRYSYMDLPGVKKKKPRHEHGVWNWCRNTPSWWIHMTHHVPNRARCRNWEKTRTEDNLDEVCPDYGRKPHIYYY